MAVDTSPAAPTGAAAQPKTKPVVVDWTEMLSVMATAMSDFNCPFSQGLTGLLNHSEKLSNAYERIDHLETKMAEKDSAIYAMGNDITELNKKVSDQSDEIDDLRAEIDELKIGLASVTDKQTADDKMLLPERLDELDQYGRRSMIRVSGVPQLSENENTLDVVLSTIKDKLNIQLEKSDIDRTHRLGPFDKDADKPRNIVIKFSNYTARTLIYGQRKKLSKAGMYMNDHLTAIRSRLLYVARQYKKLGLLNQAWSSEGRILIKDKGDKTHVIVSLMQLVTFDPKGEFVIPDEPNYRGR